MNFTSRGLGQHRARHTAIVIIPRRVARLHSVYCGSVLLSRLNCPIRPRRIRLAMFTGMAAWGLSITHPSIYIPGKLISTRHLQHEKQQYVPLVNFISSLDRGQAYNPTTPFSQPCPLAFNVSMACVLLLTPPPPSADASPVSDWAGERFFPHP